MKIKRLVHQKIASRRQDTAGAESQGREQGEMRCQGELIKQGNPKTRREDRSGARLRKLAKVREEEKGEERREDEAGVLKSTEGKADKGKRETRPQTRAGKRKFNAPPQVLFSV
ncbi:hypothetical protein E2C01_045628 [Portunus trituberculatus]|uniref:Uncharacterized protein n=1 Tax=Portunus trituberculatus TaxID=210409 RepID=A0A5B7G5K1_PORTR|nr:hypothetical protein [Portunus trituberculatus]